MKITHAVWEKRNMGVDCYEVCVEKGDTFEMFKQKQPEFETEYTVVKIAPEQKEFAFKLQDEGYRFVEIITTFMRDCSIPELSGIQSRIAESSSYEKASPEDIEYLINCVRQGMFITDRVSVDPYFTKEQAANRYIGWIGDELERGTEVFNILYRGNIIGFFMIRYDGNQASPPLAGIYSGTKIAGCGFLMDYFEIMEANKRGARKITATVSSSNRPAYSLPVSLGYGFSSIDEVYVKHITK